MKTVMTHRLKGLLRNIALSATMLLISGSLFAAQAAITRIGNWTQVNNNTTANPATGTLVAGASASGKRALVVAVSFDWATTQSTGATTATSVTYGTQPMTQATWVCANTTGGRCSGLFYLLDAGITAASNTTTSITLAGTGGVGYNFVSYGATFDNVSQTAPIADFSTNTSVAASVTTLNFGKSVAIGAGDELIYIRTVDALSTFTLPTNYTHPLTDSLAAHSSVVGQRTVPLTGLSENISVVGTGNQISTMSVAVLNEYSYNALTSCSGCHGYPAPLVDSGTRDATTGTFVGDHAKHNYACDTCHATLPAAYGHRNGKIDIKNATIGVSDNGSYTGGTAIPQTNSPALGSCNNVNCHKNNNTGAWGGGGYTCETSPCHGFPPATGAHTKHYTAKGWATGSYAMCVGCHPNNFTGHSNVTDNIVVIATVTPAGVSPAITCSNTVAGCHNGKSTPAWNTAGIACTSCHTAGGAAAGDPNSGLHATTNLVNHDDAFGTGGTCASCHSSTTPSSGHFNATVETSAAATYTWNTTNIPAGYVRASDSCAAAGTCHTDGGTWNRKWLGVTDAAWAYANNAATAPVCGNCHGSFLSGWNIIGATDHVNPSLVNDPATLATSKSNHGECSSCHGWGSTTYSTGVDHINNTLEMNSTLGYAAGACATNCHAGQTLTMNAASGWTDATVVGPSVVCGECHTAGVTTTAASAAHNAHGATFASVAANPASIALCISCHGNDGTGATHNNGTVNFATVTYSQAATRGNLTGTCLTANCHNVNTKALQSTAWNTTALNCNSCHFYPTTTPAATATTKAANLADGRPLSGTHSDHFDGGKLCTQCHGAMPVAGDTTHVSGTTLTDRAVAVVGDIATVSFTDAAAVTDYTFENTGNTCYTPTNNGLGCHATAGLAGALDVTRPDWDLTIAATACTACHTNTTTTAVNPNSGLHSVTPTVTGQRHDGTIAGSCAVCHNTMPVAGTHKNGDFTGDTVANLGLRYYAQTAANTGTCAATTCHVAGTGGLGSSDDWAHEWNSTANFYTTNTTACEGCHGDKTSGWNTGVIHRAGGTITTHGGTNVYGCKDCHGLEAAATTYTFAWSTNDWGGTSKHGNGTIEINNNGTTLYNTTTNVCATCHTATGADGIHNFVDTGYTIANIAVDPVTVSCTGCHNGSGGGALNISSASSHVTRGNKAGYNTFIGCENCHPMHTGGTLVPNNTTVGINYTASARTGFRLGGDATTGTTEAEICWNCHNNMTYQTTALSEWGTNNKAATGASPYNYGTVTSPNWTAATWSSSRASFSYKTGAIQSTHTANPLITDANLGGAAYGYTETKNLVGEIRCSNCHDVHELAMAPSDTKAGTPYLRGTWKGNPYEEDGAPRTENGTISYTIGTGTNSWGNVPRADTSNLKLGGFFIDQNNAVPMSSTPTTQGTAASNPTSSWTLATSAGLCTMCHGTNVDIMDQKNDGVLWVGTNGHSNAVIGGTGTAAVNIYDTRGGAVDPALNPFAHYSGWSGDPNRSSAGFRTGNATYAVVASSGLALPKVGIDNGATVTTTRPYKYKTLTGGFELATPAVEVAGQTTAQVQFHKFSCSKCHNPHASRLPKLMITNCLDTKKNTWDNGFGKVNTTNNVNVRLSNFTSAQNCHRLTGDDLTDAGDARGHNGTGYSGAGWNKVTPW